ncbi:MAG: FtsQ-type POTRA domain-containing protein [Alphaproteobacteria bacterium]|nr:FtsQ-type POTRA domain-containing protein [Alphaproteobacteria bacterium]
MYKFLFFFILLFPLEAMGKLITSIEVSGLKRTNPAVVRNAISIQEGDDFSSFSETEVRQALNKLGLFSSIEVSAVESSDDVKIKINLKEKITKLVVPLAKSGTNETAVGLLFLDSNFLARGDLFVAVAIYGQSTNLYSIGLDNKHFLDTNFTNKMYISYDSSQFSNQSILHSSIYKEYFQKTAKASYAFGYDFGWITPLLSVSYKNFAISNKINDRQKGETYAISPIVSIDKMTYADFLAHGFDGKVSVSRNITKIDNCTIPSTAFTGQSSYSFKTSNNNKVLMALDTFISDLPFIEQNRTSYGRGMRSLVDRNISYQNFFGGTLSNEYLFHRNTMFGFSNINFVESGKINGEFDKHYVAYTGIGSGINIYFRKVAIPAVGLYITNNFRTKAAQVIFVMGMSI